MDCVDALLLSLIARYLCPQSRSLRHPPPPHVAPTCIIDLNSDPKQKLVLYTTTQLTHHSTTTIKLYKKKKATKTTTPTAHSPSPPSLPILSFVSHPFLPCLVLFFSYHTLFDKHPPFLVSSPLLLFLFLSLLPPRQNKSFCVFL